MHRRLSTRPWAILAAAALAIVSAGVSPAATPGDVAGLWAGEVRHNNQAATFAVRLTVASDSTLTVAVSLPAIDVRDLELGAARVDGDTLRLGAWELAHDRGDSSLRGRLPGSLVPVYEIPFRLSPVDSLAWPVTAAQPAPVAAPVWTADVGSAVWAGLTADGDRVCVGSDDGFVRALQTDDGAVIWETRTGGPIRARPTPDGSRLYVHSDDGFLYRLRMRDGGVDWRTRLASGPTERIAPGQAGSRYDHYASAAVVADGVAYVGAADGHLLALAADDGARLWSFTAGERITATPTVRDDRVYIGSFDGCVYAVSASDGALLWTHDTGAPVVGAAAVAGPWLLVGSRSYDLLALDPDTGVQAWKHYVWFSWIESPAVVGDGVAYVGSSDAQQLIALDLQSHRPRWTYDTGGSVWSAPALGGMSVYAGSIGVFDYIVDHEAQFLAAAVDTGRPRWRYPLPRPGDAYLWGFAGAAAVDSVQVYVGTLDGRILAFLR